MKDPHPPRQHVEPLPIRLIVAAVVAFDLLATSVVNATQSDVLSGLVLGTVAGQFGLLAVWAVLSPQPWTVRVPGSFVAVVALYVVLAAGATLTAPHDAFSAEMVQIGLLLPLAFLAAQVPLWLVKIAIGARIDRAATGEPRPHPEARQFRLQDLLGATAVVAVVFGLASLGLRDPTAQRSGLEAWQMLLIACLLLTVWSAFSTLPCLWAGFVARDKPTGALAMLIYTAVMTFVVLTYLNHLTPGAATGRETVILFALHGGLVGSMLGMFYALRSWGYVLMWTRRRKPAQASADSSPEIPPAEAGEAEDEHGAGC